MCRDEPIVFIVRDWYNWNVFVLLEVKMKNFYLIVLLILTIPFNCFAGDYDSWNEFVEDSGYDWTIHLTVGAVTSMATIYYTPDDWNRWVKYGCGIMASLAVGGIIESFDENWDNQDFWEYSYGGAAGAVFMVVWDVDWKTGNFKLKD